MPARGLHSRLRLKCELGWLAGKLYRLPGRAAFPSHSPGACLLAPKGPSHAVQPIPAHLPAQPITAPLPPLSSCSGQEMESRRQLFDDALQFKLGPAAAPSAAAADSWGLPPAAAAAAAAEPALCIEIVREGLAPAGPL